MSPTPSTNPDNLPYEILGDQPGVTLHGGLDGTHDILAEQVQTKFVTTDAAIADLQNRGGWHAIRAGEAQNVASFDVDLTDGGRFPAGTFSTWKMRLNGRGDGAAEAQIRVNDISTSTYRWVQTIADPVADTVEGSSSISATQWRVADWGGGAGLFNPAEFTLSVISTGVVAQWQSTDLSSGRRASYGGGRHDGAVTPTKLTVMVGGGVATEFIRVRWEVEGYITPDFTVPD